MPPYALVWIAAASILGTLAAAPLALGERMLASTALTLFVLVVTRGRCGPSQFRLAVLVALVASSANAAWHTWHLPQVMPLRTARYGGTITAERAASQGLTEVTIALDSGPRVLATLRNTQTVGTHVVIRGALEPFDGPRNPGEPSEREQQAARGLAGRIRQAQVLSHSRETTTSAIVWLARAHAWALAQLRARLGDVDASIVAGELWGERDALAPDVRAEFQETGTVHILVTAGLHVGLVAALVVLLLGSARVPRVAACIGAVFAVWAFALWSGGDLPSVRAATMVSMMLLARACGRSSFSWNALAGAAIVICAMLPLTLATPSFWLSFACVSAIFALAPLIDAGIERAVALPHRVREALVLTIATQLGTWPITAAVFLQFSWCAIVANVAIVPLVPVTMVLGALQLALAPVSPLAQAVANLNAWVLAWTLGVVHLLASLPSATIVMTPAPTWCIAAYEGALLAFTPLWRRGAATLAIATLILATSYVLLPPRSIEHDLEITMIDVGQADSLLIVTPAHHTILVDGGGRLERGPQGDGSVAERVGEEVVVPFLIRHGIHHLDAIVLSHPHGEQTDLQAQTRQRLEELSNLNSEPIRDFLDVQ